MSQSPLYVGLDVSKVALDIVIGPTDQNWQAHHTEEGIRDLVTRLVEMHPSLMVLAHFAEAVHPTPRPLPHAQLQALEGLLTRT